MFSQRQVWATIPPEAGGLFLQKAGRRGGKLPTLARHPAPQATLPGMVIFSPFVHMES